MKRRARGLIGRSLNALTRDDRRKFQSLRDYLDWLAK